MRRLTDIFLDVFLKIGLFDEFSSALLRRFYYWRYKIKVGLYSYGCFDRKRIPAGTVIGRYCSFSRTSTILNGNHGIEYITTHPFLYNKKLGMVEKENIERSKCVIGDDVWLGHNSIILPGVNEIGRGAIIAAGAVVTKNVPPYAIVAGMPARVIKYRFDPIVIEKIEKSYWWEMDRGEFLNKLKLDPDFFYNPSLGISNEQKN